MRLHNTDDTRIAGMAEVIAASQLIDDLPLNDANSKLVFETRAALAAAIHKRDDRLVVIVGPCSIHDPVAAVDYGRRLAPLIEQHRKSLLVVMRVYFEKPRTTVGWKGLINDPHLNNSYDISEGLHLARRLLLELAEMGVPAATEFLDPITPQYLGDVVAWSAIGARTTESQIHRQLASGLSCPVGFKNSTEGSTQIAVDALRSAREPHIFLSVTKSGHCAIFETSGNPDCHVILRGGANGPNYQAKDINRSCQALKQHGLSECVMVDCSHGNSEKDPERQVFVAEDIARQLEAGTNEILGVMIESNLVAGRQEISHDDTMVYGKSVTDACIDWTTTVKLIERLARANTMRQASRRAE